VIGGEDAAGIWVRAKVSQTRGIANATLTEGCLASESQREPTMYQLQLLGLDEIACWRTLSYEGCDSQVVSRAPEQRQSSIYFLDMYGRISAGTQSQSLSAGVIRRTDLVPPLSGQRQGRGQDKGFG
jgi:hypothetical protein